MTTFKDNQDELKKLIAELETKINEVKVQTDKIKSVEETK